MCGLNDLYGCVPMPGAKLTAVQVKVCMFLINVAEDFQLRCPRLPEMSWEDFLKVKRSTIRVMKLEWLR